MHELCDIRDIFVNGEIYSGGKKNPDLPIKSTKNLNMSCRHCKRLVTTPLMLCCVYTISYMKYSITDIID